MVKTRSNISPTSPIDEKCGCSGRKSKRRRSITMPQKTRKPLKKKKAIVDGKTPDQDGKTVDSTPEVSDPAEIVIFKDSTDQHLADCISKSRISRSKLSKMKNIGASTEIAVVNDDVLLSPQRKNKQRSSSVISEPYAAANGCLPKRSTEKNLIVCTNIPVISRSKHKRDNSISHSVEMHSNKVDEDTLLFPNDKVKLKDISELMNRASDIQALQDVTKKKRKKEKTVEVVEYMAPEPCIQECTEDEHEDLTHEKGWTADQDMALQNAYFEVRPCSNFWFEVSKKVSGKTAKECFDRFYSAYPTPPATQARSRKATTDSPVRTLSFPSPLSSKPRYGRGKQGLLKAHQTVRNILRQQTAVDESYEADVFSAVEESLPENCTKEPDCGSSGSSDSYFGKPENHTGGMKRRKAELDSISSKACANICQDVSTFEGNLQSSDAFKRDILSPEVLKRETNPARLDKYLDMLHLRRVDKKKSSNRGAPQHCLGENKENSDSKLTNSVSAARNAIISSAKDVLKVLTQKSTIEEETNSLSDDVDEESMDMLDED